MSKKEEGKVIQMTPKNGELKKEVAELSPEEQRETNFKAQIEEMNKRKVVSSNEMSELFKKLNDTGYGTYQYNRGAKVEISSELFTGLVNFVAAVSQHNENVAAMLQQSFKSTVSTMDALALGGLEFQVELTKHHIEFCDAGLAKPVEEHEANEAETRVTQKAPSKKKK